VKHTRLQILWNFFFGFLEKFRKKNMAGTARKSTGSRKKASKSVRAKVVRKAKAAVEIDPTVSFF